MARPVTLVVCALLLAASVAIAQPPPPILYLYDDLGRLVRVIDPTGQSATYHWDPVGNLLRITRESNVPRTATVGSVSTSRLRRATTTTLSVTGFNFSGATITASAGLSIVSFQAGVDTLAVEVLVDPGTPAGPASLTVETPYGVATIPLVVVVDTPTIDTVTPTTVFTGSAVTIDGTNFDVSSSTATLVRFNGVQGTILEAMTTRLRVRVPATATTGRITVTTAGGTATSDTDLIVRSLGTGRAHVPTADLLAYWTFDQDGRDSLGGFDLTLQGGLDVTLGRIENALRFPGDPARLAVRPGDDDVLDFGAADFSLALWALWTTLDGEQVLVEKCQGATGCGGGGWSLTKLADQSLLFHPLVRSAPNAVQADRWYQVTVVREGASVQLYLDGTLVATGGGFPITPVADPFQIGERAGAQQFPMHGLIDEVGVWTRALTPDEVTALAVGVPLGPPVIAAVAPAKAIPGMAVTLTGAHFDAQAPTSNTVAINGTPAAVLQATPSALKVRVPAGATTGLVTVTTTQGTATSPAPLTIGSLGAERAAVPTTDLLAYWSFDTDGRDDADSLDLTFQGGLDLTPGRIGGGLRFTGEAAKFAIRPEDDPALDFGTADFSVALWARWATLGGEQVLVEKCQGATGCGGGGWSLTKLSDQSLLFHPLVRSAPNAVQVDHWHHVAVVRAGGTARIYLDGVEIASSGAGGIPPVADPFQIGERAGGQQFPMNGIIDEVGVWARALTPDEVAGLAAMGP